MRILLTGSQGQVGSEFRLAAAHLGEIVPVTRSECDLTVEESVRNMLRRVKPDVIVNTAAYTAVDLAESNRDACFAVNATAPGIMAQEAASSGALLIHYSSDYVFNGEKHDAYVEEDETAPLGVYGESKVAGEAAILASATNAIILRTSWVYSTHGKNFLLTMLRLAAERPELKVVADQFGGPTSAKSIARATARLIQQQGGSGGAQAAAGIFHMTAGGEASWCDFARAIVDRAGLGHKAPKVTPITTESYPTPAKRPRNSVLSNEKFAKTFGFRLPPWQEQLDEVMADLR